MRALHAPVAAPERAVTAVLCPDLRYPRRIIPAVKTDWSVVRPARVGAWSQGCDEQISGDA
jgi:hypothetical protein